MKPALGYMVTTLATVYPGSIPGLRSSSDQQAPIDFEPGAKLKFENKSKRIEESLID